MTHHRAFQELKYSICGTSAVSALCDGNEETCDMQARRLWFTFSSSIYISFPSSCASLTCLLSTQHKLKTTAACENYTTSKTSLNTLQHCLGFVCAMNVPQFTSTVLPITGINVMCSCLKPSHIFFLPSCFFKSRLPVWSRDGRSLDNVNRRHILRL